MENISADIHKLQQQLNALSSAITAEDGDIYACPDCRDTGWVSDGVNAYPCHCQEEARLAERQAAAGLSPKLARSSFADFSLDNYSRTDKDSFGDSYRSLAEQALRSCLKFVTSYVEGRRGLGLMLIGDTGCGKTHLAAAIANALLEQGAEVLFLVVPEFLDQLRGSYRRENEGLDETEIVRRAYAAPVLILDDLGAHNFSEWVQNKLFTIINYRLNNELPCVITSNLSPEEMNERIGARTTSRLMESCVFLRLAVARDIRKELYQRDF